MPETGMGYQVIEASKGGYYARNRYIVLNEQLAVPMDSDTNRELRKIFSEGIRRIQLSSATIELRDIRSFSEVEFRNVINEHTYTSTKGANQNPKQRARGDEQLVRLSAFENDMRIDTVNNCLRPGSYTTSFDDYMRCKVSGDDPIERYALPNNEVIKWVFHIRPANNDHYQRGIVQPAFDKRGGGEEFFFENGTSRNTYLPPPKSY